jgi:hypothetical protein
MKEAFLIIFLFSCGHVKVIEHADRNKTAMTKFKLIDDKLNSLAEKLNANILKEGSGYYINDVPVPLEYIEDRRIVWIDGLIGKAIIIQPHFGFETVNFTSPRWNFLNLAWLEHDSSGSKEKPFWEHYLLKRVEFEVIESNIDQLLVTSRENLERIKREDLK